MISFRTKFVTFKVEANVNFSNQNSWNSRSSVKWHRNSQCESYKNLDIPRELDLFSDFHKPLEKVQGFKAESFGQMESIHNGVFHGYSGLDVATCGDANATRFSPLATNFWRMVASLTTQISSYYSISVIFFFSWDQRQIKWLLPPFLLIRDFGKTKHLRKRFQNFRQSYALLTDRIEIHQWQPLVWPSDLLYVMQAGCD